MSLLPTSTTVVPAQTARVAKAAFPTGTLCLRMYDHLGAICHEQDGAERLPPRGQPAAATPSGHYSAWASEDTKGGTHLQIVTKGSRVDTGSTYQQPGEYSFPSTAAWSWICLLFLLIGITAYGSPKFGGKSRIAVSFGHEHTAYYHHGAS